MKLSKQFPSDKINGTKNAINLRFLYELKHMVRLSINVCEIFHFRFGFPFIKVYIFVQENA